MTEPERLALKALLSAAKGARDTLDKVPKGTPPGDSRIGRDLARLDRAIGAGEAMLSGAGVRGTE
jgi:hypothetical protein